MPEEQNSQEMPDHNEEIVGLNVLREISTDTEKPRTDIIAVHGLNKSYQDTWCEEQEDGASSCWLTDVMPQFSSINHGRMMTYEYQSDLLVQNILDESTFEKAALRFLEDLHEKRKEQSEGPIVFLCHNIGGLLVKKALWIANHAEKFLQIAHSARLLVLFGTPGTSCQWEEVLFNLVLTATPPTSRKRTVQVALETGPAALQAASSLFDSFNGQYDVLLVSEDRSTPFVGIVVPRDSQPSPSKSKLASCIIINTDHQNLCKSPNDELLMELDRKISVALQSSRKKHFLEFLECRQTIASLCPTDLPIGHMLSRNPMPGTLKWTEGLLNGQPHFVPIYGAAGSGKSVVASWLSRRLPKDKGSITLSYCFSVADYRRTTYPQLLLSWMHQLLYQETSILESAYVRKLYSRISWDRPLCAAELHRLLQAMLCRLSETWIYFVIDAVDECDHTVSHLLCDLQRLAKANGKYRVFLTSKPQDSIKTILQEFESESVDLDQEIEEDKALFLSHKLETHGLLDFKEPLLATPNTTMLQLELMIYLLSLIQPEERRALEISALSDYDDLYTRIFARVRAPHSWLKEALFCIAFSERPLTVQELSTALGINTLSNTSQISLQEIGISTTKTLQKDLKLALGPLVRIEDETVYLIHTTLRGFIMSQRLSFPGSSSAEPPSGESSPAVLLAQKCSTYLSLPEIQKEEATIRMSTPSSNSDKHIEGNLFPHPTDASSGFLSYAVECWHLHLRRCKEESDEIRGLFSSFWEDQTTMKEWINLREAMPPSVRSATRPKPPPEALNSDFEFGACFGLANIVASLAKEDDFSDSNLGQGIQLALEAGHVDTVKALLPYVKSSDEWKKWLKSACRYGYLTLVDFILSAPDEARQAITQSELNDCLETATENGHWPIIASLLTAGADFDSTMKQKLLRLATARGYEGVVSTLLAAGATLKPSAEDGTITENTDSEDSFLYLAAEFGSAAVLKVVAPGADLDIKCGPWNAPAIHVTSEEDYAEAAETLLDLGAEVDAVDEYGASALLLACARNSEEVARVLLSRGANPDHVMRVSPKYRALQVAAHQGYPKVVRLLLESGAFASAPNTEYGTPLHIAISNMDSYNQDGYFEVVKLLLQFNADVNSQQENGSTPLHLAVKRGTPGMERIVRLLREEGADVDKLDNSKRSPLFYAVQDKYEFARLLWDRRSSWNRFSEATISVLFDASKLGLESRVGLLIDAGCKLEEKDVFGRIARDVALKLEVRRLLSVDGQDSGDDEIDICPFVTQAVQARRKFRQIAEWACDVCERGIWEEAFYHCCGCAKNCESGYTLFDLCLECHGGERGNLCRQDKHKLRRRFVGHEMTSFEEFSPNIANFGVKKSLEEDAKLDADTEVNVDKKVDIKEKSDIDPNINTNDNVDTEENVDIEENVDTLEGADTDERLDASEKVQSKEKVGVDEKAEVDETADANMKVDTHERVNIDVKGDGD